MTGYPEHGEYRLKALNNRILLIQLKWDLNYQLMDNLHQEMLELVVSEFADDPWCFVLDTRQASILTEETAGNIGEYEDSLYKNLKYGILYSTSYQESVYKYLFQSNPDPRRPVVSCLSTAVELLNQAGFSIDLEKIRSYFEES